MKYHCSFIRENKKNVEHNILVSNLEHLKGRVQKFRFVTTRTKPKESFLKKLFIWLKVSLGQFVSHFLQII